MPPAGNGQRPPFRAAPPHGLCHVFYRTWFEDARYRRAVQP
jgi:hypothetical protein